MLRSSFYQGFFTTLILIGFGGVGHSLKINSDGGYEIVVALDESTPVPEVGVGRYVDNIKTSLGVFSSRLWVTTKTRFYLKSADILIPSHWTLGSSLSATTQSYESADIRLSPNVSHPHAENPNICGEPGNYIELPQSFFNVTNTGPYGLHWKSLLHTWAIYRYGVHPEHGFVGDSKYPYAQRDLLSNQWRVTGCSNAEIKGKFMDLKNPDANCATGTSLSDSCRFVPDTVGQNATSSLMHFHWIESVTEFCDEHTHVRNSKNKQNALCDHKSVWEVIRESPDYLAVTSPRGESVPRTTFRTVKHSATPIFYLLLDRGLVQGSYPIAVRVLPLVANFLGHQNLTNTVASVGAYPSGSPDVAVRDLVEWLEIGKNLDKFIEAVGTLRNDGPLERDFSRALMEVADKIKSRSHPNGAVVLLVKFGADLRNMDSYLPEPEVLHAFNEGNIILNSIELNFPNHTSGYSHLANVCRGTGGSYAVLDSYGEVELSVLNVLNYARRTLATHYTDLDKNWKLLRKENLNVISNIAVPDDLTGSVQIFISAKNPNLAAGNFKVNGFNYGDGSDPRELKFRFKRTLDWNEEGGRVTYHLEVPKSELGGINQLSLHQTCTSVDCSSSILARAQFSKDVHKVKIEVGTSAQNQLADLSNGRPVSIFAKVTKNGVPVEGVLVTATLTDTVSSRSSTVRLVDNGEATPDAEERDGIYSAYFAPEIDGVYKVTVSVEGNPSFRRRRRSIRGVDESAYIRLLPVDQEDVGCGSGSCATEIIEGGFSQTVEITKAITVTQALRYAPAPSKIGSLTVIDRPDLGQVTLYWLAPSIPGRMQSVTSYELRSAPSMDLLITSFENQTAVPIPPNARPKPPVNMEVLSVQRPSESMYYAVRSTYRGKKSAISNIAEVLIPVSPTPTPTPPPSTSTSSGSTDITGSTPSTNSTGTTPSGPPDITTPSGGPTNGTESTTPSRPTDGTGTTPPQTNSTGSTPSSPPPPPTTPTPTTSGPSETTPGITTLSPTPTGGETSAPTTTANPDPGSDPTTTTPSTTTASAAENKLSYGLLLSLLISRIIYLTV